MRCIPKAFMAGFLEKFAGVIEESMHSYPLVQAEKTLLRKHTDQVPAAPEDKAVVAGSSHPEKEEEEEEESEKVFTVNSELLQVLEEEAVNDPRIKALLESQKLSKGLKAPANLSI